MSRRVGISPTRRGLGRSMVAGARRHVRRDWCRTRSMRQEGRRGEGQAAVPRRAGPPRGGRRRRRPSGPASVGTAGGAGRDGEDSLTWRSALYLAFSMASGWPVHRPGRRAHPVRRAGDHLGGRAVLALLMVALAAARRCWSAGSSGRRSGCGSRARTGGCRRAEPAAKLRAMAADPATWKDLVYLGCCFPMTLAEFVVSVTCGR